VDGATFNPETMEAFSSQRDGTLTVIKEKSPTGFEVEQTVQMMQSAKISLFRPAPRNATRAIARSNPGKARNTLKR